MASLPLSAVSTRPSSRTRSRTALVVSADVSFRKRLQRLLSGLRWRVAEAANGAEAWEQMERQAPEVLVADSWLPDLDAREFLLDFCGAFPQVDIVTTEETEGMQTPRSPYRQEVLYALRSVEEGAPTDAASWNTAYDAPVRLIKEIRKPVASVCVADQPAMEARSVSGGDTGARDAASGVETGTVRALQLPAANSAVPRVSELREVPARAASSVERLPELIGNAPCMLDVSRRVRLVAPRNTPVLIEGPTGSGKELVAEALHRLSSRSRKPLVTLNCAAIPEALLEAELFGHTRGAFTGAVQGRMGRIEAADGGTLFLDEIGEMPLALQAKLLRFVECGELQRVGDNEIVKVDVRVIAATHRQLTRRVEEGSFRADLYYRLAVFLIRTPPLAEHMQDLPQLVEHFLEKMGRSEPVKRIGAAALGRLGRHAWPGNVRELEHVLERAAILAGDSETISAEDIDFGSLAE